MSHPALTIVALDYLWWGVCAGGRHYTGKIQCNGKTIELERTRSRKEAKEMAEREERRWLQHECVTNKFDSLAQLEAAATAWCEKNLGDNWLLQEHTDCNPERPIAGKGYIKERLGYLRQLAEMWDKVPNSQRTPEAFKIAFKAWNTILDPNSK